MKNKNRYRLVLASFLGMLLLPLSVTLAAEWGVNLGTDSSGNWSINAGVGSGSSGWSLSNPYGLPGGSILGILSNLLFWLLAIFGIAGIVGFVISGIIYLVSTGDDNAISRAKTAMTWSIVGIIVGLSGFVIMQAVMALLSGASNKF